MTNIKIVETKYINEKTKSGRWSTVKVAPKTQEVTKEFYENVLTWKPQGERRTSSYTYLGYVVTKITTPSPTQTYRVVREYDFELESK